jgi:hypothetical protein
MTYVFPLYDMLINQIKDCTYKEHIDYSEFVSRVNSLDKKGKELVYALIQSYWKHEDKQVMFTFIPYNGQKVSEKTFKWNINNLPFKLQHIIKNFTIMHHVKMLNDVQKIKQ